MIVAWEMKSKCFAFLENGNLLCTHVLGCKWLLMPKEVRQLKASDDIQGKHLMG